MGKEFVVVLYFGKVRGMILASVRFGVWNWRCWRSRDLCRRPVVCDGLLSCKCNLFAGFQGLVGTGRVCWVRPSFLGMGVCTLDCERSRYKPAGSRVRRLTVMEDSARV